MKKKFLAPLLIIIFLFSLVPLAGCGKTDEQKKKEGYKKYQDIGLEFKMGKFGKSLMIIFC